MAPEILPSDDEASHVMRDSLPAELRASLAGAELRLTFVTVG